MYPTAGGSSPITETCDFASLCDKWWYVDKTNFIKTILDDKSFLLITAPKCFGKSTNMGMLKTFLGIEMDSNGQRVQLERDKAGCLTQEQESRNFNLFKDKKIFTVVKDGKRLFNKGFFTNHFGRYPIIYVSFKNLKGYTYNEVLDSLKVAIHESFLQHKYLEESDIWDKWNTKKLFTQYIHSDKYKTMNELHVECGLRLLSELLCQYFKGDKKVYIFMDDCDAVFYNVIYNKNVSESDMEDIFRIIFAITLNLLENNPCVERGLLTASHPIGDLFSFGVKRVRQRRFLQSFLLYNFCGFTSDEVKDLLEKKGSPEKITDLKIWYNGYGINLYDTDNFDIYCPWSVINYLDKRQLRTCWCPNSLNALQVLLGCDKICSKMASLISGETVKIMYRRKLTIDDIIRLKLIINTPSNSIDDSDADLFLQFLYENAYFKAATFGKDFLNITIPNRKTYSELHSCLFSFNFIYDVLQSDQG